MPTTSPFADQWSLDPGIDYLNHGSFGACPVAILQRQQELRDELEREPVQFLTRRMQPLIDDSREALAGLVNVRPEDLAMVPNATAGANTVLRSLPFNTGDEILVTNLGYNACNNAARYVAERTGAKVVSVELSFPLASPDEIVETLGSTVSDRTRLVVIDHVTSATGLVLPLKEIVERVHARGAEVLVDGAHAPGMVPVDLEELGAEYYTGNCHKWLCSPKGAGFLHVRADRQDGIAPLIVSHGWNTPRPGRSRFSDLVDWPGTLDPTAWACVADAVRFVRELMPGGLGELREKNRTLVIEGRDVLCEALGIDAPAPDEMIGSLATIPLPDEPSSRPRVDASAMPTPSQLLHDRLFDDYRIEVPCFYFPRHPHRAVRISAQAYNSIEQYRRLAVALLELLEKE